MPQAPSITPPVNQSVPQALALSPAAKRLSHLLSCKLPIQREDEAIKDLLKVIKACSREELSGLGLQPPPVPELCLQSIGEHQPLAVRLGAVQSFISSFEYNQCTGYNYNVLKQRPLQGILATAAGILAQPLPIKCIEAVFMGILLTQGWSQLQRLPVGFKSRGADGQVYRHIILAVCDTATGLYGALGISRCRQLMDKPLQYSSLAALVQDYHEAYRHVKHELLRVRVGLPVEHDPSWMGPVCWRFCTVNMRRRTWQEAADMLNKHAVAAAELQQQFRQASAHTTGSSGTRSVPQSPRGSPSTANRPQSALRVRCITPDLEPEQHLPTLSQSPHKQQTNGSWRSPSNSLASSPGPAAKCRSPTGRSYSPQCGFMSPRRPAAAACTGTCAPDGAVTHSKLVQPTNKVLATVAAEVHSSREFDTSDDDGSDSDSEVEAVVQKLMLHRV